MSQNSLALKKKKKTTILIFPVNNEIKTTIYSTHKTKKNCMAKETKQRRKEKKE